MERINQTLASLPETTQEKKICKYTFSYDDPDYKEPSVEERRAEWLLKHGGVTSLDNTFETMRKVKGQEKMVAAFKELLTNPEWFMLMVYGGTGNGKTRCCEAMVLEMMSRVIYAKRQRWSDIVRDFKDSFNNREGLSYQEKFDKLRTQPFLIIDDVGCGSTGGNWEWGELEDIVDYRLEHGFLTVITTNLDIKEIPPRIISRLRDKRKARLIFNEAIDQRPFEGLTKDTTT